MAQSSWAYLSNLRSVMVIRTFLTHSFPWYRTPLAVLDNYDWWLNIHTISLTIVWIYKLLDIFILRSLSFVSFWATVEWFYRVSSGSFHWKRLRLSVRSFFLQSSFRLRSSRVDLSQNETTFIYSSCVYLQIRWSCFWALVCDIRRNRVFLCGPVFKLAIF